MISDGWHADDTDDTDDHRFFYSHHRVHRVSRSFFSCHADDTKTPPFFSRDTRVSENAMFCACRTHRGASLLVDVFIGRSTLRPYYPYEGWKNIKSAVIRLICVICVPFTIRMVPQNVTLRVVKRCFLRAEALFSSLKGYIAKIQSLRSACQAVVGIPHPKAPFCGAKSLLCGVIAPRGRWRMAAKKRSCVKNTLLKEAFLTQQLSIYV